MKTFTHRVAAITGAGSGIGRAIAESLAEAGCHLALADISETGLEQTAATAGAKGVEVSTRKLDVANRDAVYSWADDVVRHHGSVNLVFNNAGVSVGSSIEEMSYEDFEWLMNINFWGVVYGSKAFLPHLERADQGHIVNISSAAGLMSFPMQSAYSAAKFAVRGFTDALRQELEIKRSTASVSGVYPGSVKTGLLGTARMDDSFIDSFSSSREKIADQFVKRSFTTPDKAARTILAGVQRNSRRILVGPDARIIDAVQRAFPALYQSAMVRVARRVSGAT